MKRQLQLINFVGIVILALVFVILVFAIVNFVLALYSSGESNHIKKQMMKCKVTITGGGIGGLYAAFLLSFFREDICLIEKEDKLGGRIEDITTKEGSKVGLLALRYLDSHKNMNWMAHLFKIQSQTNVGEWTKVYKRGKFFLRHTGDPQLDQQMCKEVFKNLTCDYPDFVDPAVAMVSIMLDEYLKDPSIVKNTPDFLTFIQARWGIEGADYLISNIRYSSNFVNSLSTPAMLEFLKKEMGFDPIRYYPVGGMSVFIDKLKDAFSKSGGRIFKMEEVSKIEKENSGYMITTTNYIFQTEKIISTIPPIDFSKIKGEVAEKITSAPQFKSITPAELSTVTVWYKDEWWNMSKYNNVNVSTVVSKSSCFNAMDILSYPYARDQHVIRAVYDDGKCIQLWKMLYETGNQHLLEQVVNEGLHQVFSDVTIPKPKGMAIRYVNGAWYFVHSSSMYTTKEIYDWSIDPLGDGSISLVGDGYNLDGSAWCEGSLESAQRVVTKFYSNAIKYQKSNLTAINKI